MAPRLRVSYKHYTLRKYDKLSDVEKIFGADVQKPIINAKFMATNEVIYRK